jgi:5-deoxy-glucuronate isomerase
MVFHDVNRGEFLDNADLSEGHCVLRQTHLTRGRTAWLKPGTGALQYLQYSRIILAGSDNAIHFCTGPMEAGLVCLQGAATVSAADKEYRVGRYDALYIPRGTDVAVAAEPTGCDLAEISAPVEGTYPLQFVRFADVQGDPGLHFKAGGPGSTRELNILLGKNILAGRILAGVTFSEPGNWTSWPPHEHGELLEEAYLYIDMPLPAWGMQFVYTNPSRPELAVAVREGDCVLMPRGYHPNVAAPGGSINFLWMMAARREVKDRLFGVVNVQPEYATDRSGLEAGRAVE